MVLSVLLLSPITLSLIHICRFILPFIHRQQSAAENFRKVSGIIQGIPYLPVVGKMLVLSGFSSALVGYTLNYAAYFAEIFRGGLLAVDKGQYEAAQVLGFSKAQTIVRIVMPQMIRVALPSVTNESITLVKDTALMYAVAVPEILHYAKVAVSRTANPMAFVVAFVIYLIMNTILQLVFNWLEKKLAY